MFCSPPTTDAPPTGSLPLGGAMLHTPGWQPAKYSRAPKPAGGFALLPLEALVLPWLAHEQEIITPLALRGYLACIEMQQRRCQVTPETSLCYTTEELRRLLGAAVRPSSAAAVRQRLRDTGLVAWPEEGHQLTLCPQGCTVPWLDTDRYTALRAAIHPSVQQVPLPRRMLTWLAHAGAPGLIATVLSVACRALRYRDHRVIAGGSLLPTWVTATFQVARRTVAYWLQHLRALHWIAPIATPPAHRQAYGPWVAINLRWAPPGAADHHQARPPHAGSTPRRSTSPLPSPAPPRPHAPAGPRPSTDPCPARPQAHDTPLLPPPTRCDRATSPMGAPGETAGAPTASDPTIHSATFHYATLPPEVQATLYQEAETRLLQHHPRAFVIRPTVLAEIARGLETTARCPAEAPPPGAVSPPPPAGQGSPADQNLATPTAHGHTNLASPRKNLASLPPPHTSEPLDLTSPSPTPCPPHGNPVPDTQPTKHHENLRGDCALAQEQPPCGADPALHYLTLAPDLQTRLYHDAAARLRQQYPADLVIRPVVLAEVYRRLEMPPPPGTPGGPAGPLPEPPALLPAAGGTPPHPLEETSRLPAPSPPAPSAPPPLLPSLPRAPQAARHGSHATLPLPTEPGAPGERPPPPSPQAPALQAITPLDLADVARLRALWQQAQGRGWVGGSDADWLTVVTAAQHALRVGHNPGGLFVAVLRQRAWHLLTQADDDAAQQVLRAAHGPLTASERVILRQVFGRHAAGPPVLQVPPLSQAAQCAREALRLCQSARWSGDPFTVVKAAEPAWTRVRWDAALAELEQWQLRQQMANAQHQQALARAWDPETQDASASASGEEHET